MEKVLWNILLKIHSKYQLFKPINNNSDYNLSLFMRGKSIGNILVAPLDGQY